MSDNEDEAQGQRKDGRPYASGNIREDGSYEVGKGRPPVAGQFRAGDGRVRGQRAKGVRNLQSDWAAELGEHITTIENGVRRRMTKQRAIVKQTANRALNGNDKATELALKFAGLTEPRGRGPSLGDNEIVAAWLEQQRHRPLSDPAPDDSDVD